LLASVLATSLLRRRAVCDPPDINSTSAIHGLTFHNSRFDQRSRGTESPMGRFLCRNGHPWPDFP
jgi:hypothetical protein